MQNSQKYACACKFTKKSVFLYIPEMDTIMDASALPGQITVQEAADIIGCSKSRIYQYVKSGRLSARKMGPMLVLSLEEVKSFRRGPAGRQRGAAPLWRRYRNRTHPYLHGQCCALHYGR